ncbi:uncharacterized protein FIBRA_03574 [Fibroporia radiculosa]|uniref:Carotenoid oxygenase n=1 Tax=Fibroporia radiculosa TaxID=599839 RepID=J4G5X7_9APHY|nr:uncharacterized protein FIBRA_03574 [Fibroporia radiculosa]CCM01518.1 predicted protein [Fibroporia radiculosa]
MARNLTQLKKERLSTGMHVNKCPRLPYDDLIDMKAVVQQARNPIRTLNGLLGMLYPPARLSPILVRCRPQPWWELAADYRRPQFRSPTRTLVTNADASTRLEPWNNWPNDVGFETFHEERVPVELGVTGTIPSYVAGTLYRTGPGGHQVKTDRGTTYSAAHWFDGFSQTHRFQIIQPPDGSPTRVLYNSRHSADPFIESIRRTGTIPGFSFAQRRDPCTTVFRKLRSTFFPDPLPPPSQLNIGVTLTVNHPGFPGGDGQVPGIQNLYAKTDMNVLSRLHPETLEPIGIAMQQSLHPDLTGVLSASHARSDPTTGDVFNYNLAFGKHPTYRVFRVSTSTGETDILATITDAPAAYIHSAFLTENYYILCVWGAHFAWGGMKILWENNMLDALKPLDPAKQTLWYVVDRKHGRGVVAKYACDPFFAFHAVNAWEEPSPNDPSQTDIITCVPVYQNLDVLKRTFFENLKSTSPSARAYVGEGNKRADSRPILQHWRLPSVTNDAAKVLRTAILEEAAAPEASMELPVINPGHIAKPMRFVYGVGEQGKSTFVDSLVKYDVATRTARVWSVHGQSPGEPIFVANPDGSAEDDGVLMSVVLDGFREKSYLLVLDAKSMEELGRASLDCAVTIGFHGSFYPETGSGPGFSV